MLVAEYLYNLDLSQRLLPWKVSIFTTDVCKYMHAMCDMHEPNTRVYDPKTGSSVERASSTASKFEP